MSTSLAATAASPHPNPPPQAGEGREGAARPIVLVAAVALIDADGPVLLAERPEGKHLAGLWEFPGGKVQPREAPQGALIPQPAEGPGIDVPASCPPPLT